jgi:hypothetical protein
MKRREFIAGLGGVVAWPVGARAQQAGKLPTIGFLGADASAFSPWTDAFVARLREHGWIEGNTIAIEYRWSQGRTVGAHALRKGEAGWCLWARAGSQFDKCLSSVTRAWHHRVEIIQTCLTTPAVASPLGQRTTRRKPCCEYAVD